MKKVNLDVIKPWISNRITELLGLEDELVIDYAYSLLEEKVRVALLPPFLDTRLIASFFF
jgi:hypothetical protein